MTNTQDAMTVRDEDREFIRDISRLTADKQALIKGIVIGLQLREEQRAAVPRTQGRE